jgi:DNA-directed RNA polymerase subunit beta
VLKRREGMLSQANIQMDNSGKILPENVIARQEDFPVIDPVMLIYDVAPNQIASISASLFLSWNMMMRIGVDGI